MVPGVLMLSFESAPRGGRCRDPREGGTLAPKMAKVASFRNLFRTGEHHDLEFELLKYFFIKKKKKKLLLPAGFLHLCS